MEKWSVLTLEVPASPNEVVEANFARHVQVDASERLPPRRHQVVGTETTTNKTGTSKVGAISKAQKSAKFLNL